MATKAIPQAEYESYSQLLDTAYNNILDRDASIRRACDQIESNLECVGATAVEDRLQEDVVLTLETIRKAGIKVWILTGDNKETAVNVSNACGHFLPNMEHLVMADMGVDSKTRDGYFFLFVK